MNHKNFPTCLLLALLLLSASFLASHDAGAQESCVSDKCHAKLLKATTVHPVAEGCATCHESVSTPHPKKGTKTFKLTQEPPALCQTCHEAFGTKKQVHPPAQEGMCTMCHNPHASDEPKLLTRPMKELCGTCHADHLDFKVVHGPVSAGACTACHAPHESDDKTLLLRQGEDLCVGCHLDMPEVLKKKHVHPALAGGCTSCHNPHGAAHPKLLAEEGQQLCFVCHDQIREKVETSPVAHPALMAEKGCASCHSPHASDNERMLLNPEKETCLGCHNTIIAKNMTVFHGPINDGKCTPCHNPHGSQYPKLLMKAFPRDPYVPYSDTEYALCFSCHKRDLLQYPDTAFATNFRDGERNLHYLHVHNKQKGRSCRLCHNLHGSPNPKLIAESVPFGKWNLPLRFMKTETGGGCSPGCHKPQYYDRKTPGKKPDLPKPAGKSD
jgi:predicted CXXCH cytochrome family protein